MIRRRPVVLMYHGFCPTPRADDEFNLFVTVDSLRLQLDELARRGWHAITLDEYLAIRRGVRPMRPGSFLVTIDDGYQSVLELGWPILRAAGIQPVLFVLPDLVGGGAKWMDAAAGEALLAWEQLRQLADEGVELGVHGLDHTVLTESSPSDLRRHIVDARVQLEHHTGRRARTFAYPEGRWDAAVRHAVIDAGYEVGFSVHNGHDRWTVARIDVTARDTPTSFRLKLVPGYRTWWRVAGRLGGLRPLVNRIALRRRDDRSG